MSSKNPIVTVYDRVVSGLLEGKKDIHLIPSSSDDLTFAMTTSEVNGLNTTILNTTIRSLAHISKRTHTKRTGEVGSASSDVVP